MPSEFMTGPRRTAARRRGTNLSLRTELVAEARALGINISQASERGLIEEIKKVRAAHWREENREALDAYNRFVEQHGLPLEKLRLF